MCVWRAHRIRALCVYRSAPNYYYIFRQKTMPSRYAVRVIDIRWILSLIVINICVVDVRRCCVCGRSISCIGQRARITSFLWQVIWWVMTRHFFASAGGLSRIAFGVRCWPSSVDNKTQNKYSTSRCLHHQHIINQQETRARMCLMSLLKFETLE